MGNENANITDQDAVDWYNIGKEILNDCDQLNPRVPDQETKNSERFKKLYFGLAKDAFAKDMYKETFQALNRRARNLGSNNSFTDKLKNFIADSQKFCKNEASLKEFQRLLKKNNRIPNDTEDREKVLDEDDIERLIAEAKRKEADRNRKERERREKEQEAREAEERARRERLAREAAERARKRRNIFMIAAGAVALLLYGTIKYDIVQFDFIEARECISCAEECFANEEYHQSLLYLRKARSLTKSEKKQEEISDRISQVRKVQTDKANELKAEIKTLLNTFSKVSFKYGKPVNDLKKTQEKIDKLKMIDPQDSEADKLQSNLDYHNNRTR